MFATVAGMGNSRSGPVRDLSLSGVTSASVLLGRTSGFARTLELPEEISDALPNLTIGSGKTIACRGLSAVSVALRIAASACPGGRWTAIISAGTGTGFSVNPAAAREAGVALERTLWIGVGDVAATAAMCMESCAVILVCASMGIRDQRRLQARAAHTACTLILANPEQGSALNEVDAVFETSDERWEGLVGGYGHLMQREIRLAVRVRHAPPLPRVNVRLKHVSAHA